MQMHERQYFDALLREAAASFAQRCVHRAGGADAALRALRGDPQALGLKSFVDAFFAENLLEEPGGSCFVLQGLQRRTLPPDPGGLVAEVLARQARTAFAEVLVVQAAQVIQQQQIYS